jgi:hypothetical protein
MKSLRILLVVCTAAATQSALAQDPSALAAIRAACTQDARKLCAGVQPGGGRIVACLKEHKDALSDGCKQAAGLAANAGGSSASGPSNVPPASGTPAPSAAPSAPATSPSPAKTAASTPAATAKGKPATASKGDLSVGGEKFTERVIVDTEHNGMRAATIHVPEKWKFQSKVEWHYNWAEVPLAVSTQAENPDNAEAFFQYPLLRFDYIELAPQLRQYDRSRKPAPGERLPLGAFAAPPIPAMQALALFIKKSRPNVANLKWLGKQELPGLAKVLKVAPWPNQQGVAIKIGYDLNGQPVEEAFFGVYYIAQGSNSEVNPGTVKQTNWGFQGLQSFRAPAGTLEKRMPMFCVIAKSVYVNPEWARLAAAINNKITADLQQQLKKGNDELHAAQMIMQQTMREQASFQANFDKQEEAFRNSPGVDDSYLRDGGKRSAADHWDDLIRGVDTVNDPSTGGTTQLSNQGQYHFTDGFGNYRTSDNPNYTPEQAGEVGSWTQMSEAP